MWERASTHPSPEWLYAIAQGTVPGTRFFLVAGMNPDIDTGSVPEDIRPGGGIYVFPSAQVACQIVSTSASDTAAGTGARTVQVQGLTSAFAPISEVVTLNGLTPVALVNTYYRINLVVTLTVGSAESNVGDVTVRETVSLNGLCTIPADYGRSMTAVYTIPANTRAWLLDGLFTQLNLAGNAYAGYRVMVRNPGGAWISRAFVTTSDGTPTVGLSPRVLSMLSVGSDIKIRAAVVGTNNTQLNASVSIILSDL